MQNDLAALIAERCIDYYYNKLQEENIRKYNRIQRAKELRQRKYQMAKLTLLLVLVVGICMSFVQMEMKVKSRADRVAYLQSELNSIVNENRDTRKRLMDSADYNWIAQEAAKIGMTYPSPDKVIYYEIPKADYMLQTEEIPED